MHIHILGICGTFMGGLASLAKAQGHQVTGSDAHVYPPMSDQLAAEGMTLFEGYDPAQLDPAPDCVVIGNALSRGNPVVEAVLAQGLPYTSGPQWLFEHILKDRWVLAVAGTHGKTSTASLLAWILDYAGLAPGFLIGGVPSNFGCSARLGDAPFFVVEADEYDTAFFDKRSKFVHYHPKTLILNNLEYDHADIFPDIDAIKRQFHHLVRTVAKNGLIIAPKDDTEIQDVLSQGCWTSVETIGTDWLASDVSAEGGSFAVHYHDQVLGKVLWSQLGAHNVHNALAAIAAAHHAGVPIGRAINALAHFEGVKRRLEVRGAVRGVTVYDDFAHHPTAIATTLAGLRAKVDPARVMVLLEIGSNTMKMGLHREALAPALAAADRVLVLEPQGVDWDVRTLTDTLGDRGAVYKTVDDMVAWAVREACAGDHILVMSNKGFGGIHERLLGAL